jgi:glucose/mannose transport system substrate-binding protein
MSLLAPDEAPFTALYDVARARIPGIEITRIDASACAATWCPSETPDAVFTFFDKWDFQDYITRGTVGPIDEVAAGAERKGAFHPALIDAVTGADGKIYGVPLRIERDNVLFFNRDIFTSNHIAPPTSMADWFVAADALRAANVTPLVVSASGGWTIAMQLFEGVLVAEAGPDFYQRYFSGGATADAPEIAQALADLGKMLDYANDDRATVSWGDAVARVCKGYAAMVFMGDFAASQFLIDGCGADKIGYIALQPAGVPSFVFAATGFTLATAGSHRDTALEFLKVVASHDGQTAFLAARGGVPAREDLDPLNYDAFAAQSAADFASTASKLVPAYAGLTVSAFQVAVNPALQAFADPASPDHQNVDTVLANLKTNYALLRP